MPRKRILIIYRSYFPSRSHLGPATSIRNLVEAMGGDYDFHILTLNHDFTTGRPLFPTPHHREVLPHAVVEYVPRGFAALRLLARRLNENFDAVDVNCAFDPLLAIPALVMCRLGFAPRSRLCHTPHGIYMDVIMGTRRLRKTLFCRAADLLGLYRRVVHLASSPGEASDIARNHWRPQQIAVVSQFVAMRPAPAPQAEKPAERLKIAFVGRITEQKNLLAAIAMIQALKVPATLHVFGEATDPDYVRRCDALMRQGLGLGSIRFEGRVEPAELARALPQHDVLLHPTLGENFGHAIVEALHLGLPVLISDRSPWTDVEAGQAGWVLPLADLGGFVARLEAIYAMGAEWAAWSAGALAYARRTFDPVATMQRYRNIYG